LLRVVSLFAAAREHKSRHFAIENTFCWTNTTEALYSAVPLDDVLREPRNLFLFQRSAVVVFAGEEFITQTTKEGIKN